MAKTNSYSYKVKDGRMHGIFNIYQDRKGALRIVMGNSHTELTFQQIVDLGINVHALIDFEYNDFMNFYNQKAVAENV